MFGESNGMSLHFKGIVTEDGSLPMDYLEDIGRFGKVLKALSKGLFIHKNGLKRSPPGFDGIEFVMSGLQSGSTVVHIGIRDLGPAEPDMARISYDVVSKHLSGIGVDMSDYPGYEGYDPTRIVESGCKGIWKDLDGNVTLEFSCFGTSYSFDRNVRGSIIDRSVEGSDIIIIGSVCGMDCDSRRFKMRYLDESGKERVISVHYGDADEISVMDAMKNRAKMKVRIVVKGLLSGSILKEAELNSFEQLSVLDTDARLEEMIRIAFKTIKNKSELSEYAHSIRSLEEIIASNYRCTEPIYIYPAPDNGLEFEWANNDFVLAIDVASLKADFIGESDDEDFSMDMNDSESWYRLCELIDNGTGIR